MPIRIQRKRTNGWRMPEGAIYVGRPTKFGNPFWHAQRFCGVEVSLRMFEEAVSGIWDPSKFKDVADGPFYVACRDFSEFMKRFPDGPQEAIKRLLRGKDLMCWCRLDRPCHADILLKIANE
ncbi:MAG TPA: DUF4326 domain-containing protein [Terriglobia bacterium]|nr:DUF4326 domain-containing protein [Terriglobia bacterium]